MFNLLATIRLKQVNMLRMPLLHLLNIIKCFCIQLDIQGIIYCACSLVSEHRCPMDIELVEFGIGAFIFVLVLSRYYGRVYLKFIRAR